jgi:hypothetical protein
MSEFGRSREFKEHQESEEIQHKKLRDLERAIYRARIDEIRKKAHEKFPDREKPKPLDFVRDTGSETKAAPTQEEVFKNIRYKTKMFSSESAKEVYFQDAATKLGLTVTETKRRYVEWLKKQPSL